MTQTTETATASDSRNARLAAHKIARAERLAARRAEISAKTAARREFLLAAVLPAAPRKGDSRIWGALRSLQVEALSQGWSQNATTATLAAECESFASVGVVRCALKRLEALGLVENVSTRSTRAAWTVRTIAERDAATASELARQNSETQLGALLAGLTGDDEDGQGVHVRSGGGARVNLSADALAKLTAALEALAAIKAM